MLKQTLCPKKMWTIDSSDLTEILTPPESGAICAFDLGYSNIAIAQVDFYSDWFEPGVVINLDPIEENLRTQLGTNNVIQPDIILPEDTQFTQVNVVEIGNELLSLAADPTAPQPGEFTVELATPEEIGIENNLPVRRVVLHPKTASTATRPVRLHGGKIRGVPTNYAPPSLIHHLRGLPITGKITWSLSFEQHPTGAMELICDRQSIGTIRQKLKKGTELEIANIGFSVSNFDESLEEEGYYTLQVSLSGKWARPQYNQPSFLRDNKPRRAAPDGELDSECGIDPNQAPNYKQQPLEVSIAKLASKVGVKFNPSGGSSTNSTSSGKWSVRFPADTPKNASQVWSANLSELCRINQSYVDYSSPNAVYVRTISSGKQWQYQLSKIKIAYQGDCQNSPDHRGYAVEYRNIELSGSFQSEFEQYGGVKVNQVKRLPIPKWKPRTPKIVTLRTGDTTYRSPPSTVKVIKTMGLNFDASGDTKTLRETTTVDGQSFEEIEWIYGFKYYSTQVYSDADDAVYHTNPALFWGVVSYKKKIYKYDAIYGFPIGYETTGWKYLRHRQESEQAEDGRNGLDLIALDYGLSTAGNQYDELYQEMLLYLFNKVPIVERSLSSNVPFSDFYADSGDESAWVSYKACNPDGTSTTKFVKDPTWAPSHFAIAEMTLQSCFSVKLNPEFVPGERYDRTSLPPMKFLLAGDESLTKKNLTLNPARPISSRAYALPQKQDKPEDGYTPLDFFTERNIQDSASNHAQPQDKSVIETFAENEGRPSPISRRPALLIKVDPSNEDEEDSKRIVKSTVYLTTLYQYTLTTPGYDETAPVDSGGLTFNAARSLESGLTAAKTQLKLDDLQQSVNYSFEVPFNAHLRPMDEVKLFAQGEAHSTIILTVNNSINIEGHLGRMPILTWEPTQVGAGINRTIPVELHKKVLRRQDNIPGTRIKPKKEKDPKAPPNPLPWDISAEDLFANMTFRSKGNF